MKTAPSCLPLKPHLLCSDCNQIAPEHSRSTLAFTFIFQYEPALPQSARRPDEAASNCGFFLEFSQSINTVISMRSFLVFIIVFAAGSRLAHQRVCDNAQISPLSLASRPLLSSGNDDKVFLSICDTSEVRNEARRHERNKTSFGLASIKI